MSYTLLPQVRLLGCISIQKSAINNTVKYIFIDNSIDKGGYWTFFTIAFKIRQQEACTTFETMSEKAKEELKLQRERRVQHFQKSLSELAELEVKLVINVVCISKS